MATAASAVGTAQVESQFAQAKSSTSPLFSG